ncbi:hypothetical protein F4703DRAFT_1935692 [Phycomyces blakesleeanus]
MKIHLVDTRHPLPQTSGSSGFDLSGFGGSGSGSGGSGGPGGSGGSDEFSGSGPHVSGFGGSGPVAGLAGSSGPQTYCCFWCEEEVSFADTHNQPKVSVSENAAVNMVETALVYAAECARVVDPSSSKGPYTHNKGKAVDKTVPLHSLLNTLPLLQQHLYAQGQLNTFPTNDTYMTPAPDLSLEKLP